MGKQEEECQAGGGTQLDEVTVTTAPGALAALTKAAVPLTRQQPACLPSLTSSSIQRDSSPGRGLGES